MAAIALRSASKCGRFLSFHTLLNWSRCSLVNSVKLVSTGVGVRRSRGVGNFSERILADVAPRFAPSGICSTGPNARVFLSSLASARGGLEGMVSADDEGAVQDVMAVDAVREGTSLGRHDTERRIGAVEGDWEE